MLEKKPKTSRGTPTSAIKTTSASPSGSTKPAAKGIDNGGPIHPPSIHNRGAMAQASLDVNPVPEPAAGPVGGVTAAPAASTRAPAVQSAPPAVQTAAPAVQTAAPAVQTAAPPVPTAAPAVQTAAPAVPTPATQSAVPAVQTATPAAPTPATQSAVPAVQTAAPPVPAPDSSAPGTGRAGRDLPVAIGVGVGLGVAIVVSLVVYRPAFLAIVLAAVVISVLELTKALRSARVRPPVLPLMLGAVAMIAVTWLSGEGGLAVTTMLTVLAAIVWRLSDGPVGYFRDASTAVLITMYVPLLACFAVLLLRPDDGATRIVTFILVVVCSDVGGYVAGVLFGKHPMSPTVSPKKSWEGFGGSVLACMFAGMLLVALALDGAWWQGLVYGAAIAMTATLGDLGESIIKRDLGIKDMGNLLPGHGGLMDRMDSLLPSAAVAYLLLTWFIPPVLS